jgi:hypothetical protein
LFHFGTLPEFARVSGVDEKEEVGELKYPNDAGTSAIGMKLCPEWTSKR